MSSTGYRCATCGKWHDDLPFSYAADRPAAWYDVPADRVEDDVLLSSDQCVIANRFFFLRGNIEIPVIGNKQHFSWGVWVSLSKKNFERVHDKWEIPGRENLFEPLFGWLNSLLPTYPDTLNLKTNVHIQRVGLRPLIELEPTDHPLALEQRNGITMERVRDIAEQVLHSDGHPVV